MSLENIYLELGITSEHLSNNLLPRCEEASLEILEIVDLDYTGRPFVLTREAANAWRKMCAVAKIENILLEPYSGFRSYQLQKLVIAAKIRNGKTLGEVLTTTAIPGFSEHHTGRAVDIVTDQIYQLDENFEKTKAFDWLNKNAKKFGFTLSYPKNNAKGIIYEPWHWCYSK